jgi:hypothetical protein
MKKNTSRLILTLIAGIGLLASSAQAVLGLQQIMTDQGAPAVGQAVLTASKAAYAGDPAAIQNQLIAALNEAAATGNEQAVRYAIVAVMLAGGAENLGASKAAINNSNVFTNFEALTATTVAETEALMTGAGGAGGAGGGTGGGTGRGTGGGSGDEVISEPRNIFNELNSIGEDFPATPI